MTGKVVLITGASGFVGRYLSAVVQQQGNTPVGYSLRYQQDVRDYEQLRSFVAMIQPDEIHHLAAQAYVPETATNPARGYQVNVMGTVNLLEAVRQTGCRARVHIAGTSEEYGYDHPGLESLTEEVTPRPQSPYGASKLAAGTLGLVYAARYGMPIVVTRAFNHTGPGQAAQYAVASFTRQAALIQLGLQETFKVGNINAVRDYSDVRDIVRAYRRAVKLEPGVYNICSGRTVSMAEVVRMVADEIKLETPTLEVDEGLYRPMTTQGDTIMPTPDSSKFRGACAWEPQITLETTLADMVKHWTEQFNDD